MSLKKIMEPLNIVIAVLLTLIFFLLYFVFQAESIAQIKIEHVLNNCDETEMVTIYNSHIIPIYDCSKFGEQ